MLKKRLLWTAVIVLAVAGAVTGHIDRASEEQAENALKNALVTFAVARTLNGVISAAQGTEVALEPGGVGVVLSVGEILDPINDLIERFSSVMLVAASSLGLQNILLNMTGWWGVTAALGGAVLFLIGAVWWPGGVSAGVKTLALRLFLVMAFLRFALPVLIIGTHIVFSAFLEEEHDAATAVLEATSSEIKEFNEEQTGVEPGEASSFFGKLGEAIGSSIESLDVSGRIERLKESASSASEQIVNLIVIFVMQTIILPLAFLWLFVEGLKGIASRATRIND